MVEIPEQGYGILYFVSLIHVEHRETTDTWVLSGNCSAAVPRSPAEGGDT